MSNYSLEGSASQVNDSPNNGYGSPPPLFQSTISGTLSFQRINISMNYPEIENKAFLHLYMSYQRQPDTSTLTSRDLDVTTSHLYDQSISYQIFHTRTNVNNINDVYHWYSANLFLPIIKHTDGKSYVNLKLVTQFGAKYYIEMLVRGGIG